MRSSSAIQTHVWRSSLTPCGGRRCLPSPRSAHPALSERVFVSSCHQTTESLRLCACRQAHMMQFARYYSYKTDIWAPRGPRRKRAPLPPPPSTPSASEGGCQSPSEDRGRSCSSDLTHPTGSLLVPGPDGEIPPLLQDQLRRLLPFVEACGHAAAGGQALDVVRSGAYSGAKFTAHAAEASALFHATCDHAGKVWRSLLEYVYDR